MNTSGIDRQNVTYNTHNSPAALGLSSEILEISTFQALDSFSSSSSSTTTTTSAILLNVE